LRCLWHRFDLERNVQQFKLKTQVVDQAKSQLIRKSRLGRAHDGGLVTAQGLVGHNARKCPIVDVSAAR
jgi:hypothetical protein